MIKKVELKENNNTFDDAIIEINFINQNIKYIQNGQVLKDEKLDIDFKELEIMIGDYSLNWNFQYIDRSIIDGSKMEVIIETDQEIIKYFFQNKYPYNYFDFLKQLKLRVGIDE